MKSRTTRWSLLLGAAACLLIIPVRALDDVPHYEPVLIGSMIRNVYPAAGISSAVALNEAGDAVGYALIDGTFQAFVYTESHGVDLLPALSAGWPHHVAVDVTDRDTAGRVLVAGNALPASSTDQNRDPGNAMLWVYDVFAGQVVETVDIGVLPGFALSRIEAINNDGLAVGISRESGFAGGIQPMVYNHASGELHPAALPFLPKDINAFGRVAGVVAGDEGAMLADLSPDGTVSNIELRGHPKDASAGAVTALNDVNSLAVTVGFPRTDGAGRFVTGAALSSDRGWEIAWGNSAFDWAHGLNNDDDVVGNLGISSAIRGALYVQTLGEVFLIEDLVDPPGFFLDSARDINDAGWIAGGSAGAVLLKRLGNLSAPTPPANLTAVPHLPTVQQRWNAITLNWQSTSTLTRTFSVERRLSAGATGWEEIKTDWPNLQLWDSDVGLGVAYDYRVRARGIAGFSLYSNVATATTPSDPVDTEAPVVAFISPGDSQSVSGNVAVVVEASDNIGVTYLEVEVQSASLGRTTLCDRVDVTSMSCSWNTRKLDPGIYRLQAMAIDAMNNGSYHRIDVEVVSGGKGGGGGGSGGGGDGSGGSEKGRKKCTDGLDNDGDGLIDGADPDCGK